MLSIMVEGLGGSRLVGCFPRREEIPVDFEAHLVQDLELLKPPRESFATGVGIEGFQVGLGLEPSNG